MIRLSFGMRFQKTVSIRETATVAAAHCKAAKDHIEPCRADQKLRT